MGMPQRANSRHWKLLGVLLFLLIGTPLLLWLIALWTHMMPFVVPVLFWIAVPEPVFGSPLFKSTAFGYDPVGIAGWSAAVLFYVSIAFILWGVVRASLSLRKPRVI